MLKGQLTTALDWRPKKGEPSGSYSYRTGDTWSVVQYGPGYSNTFQVIAYDDAGLQWLQGIERKEVPDATDQAV